MMNPLRIGTLAIPVPIVQGGMGVGISLSGMAAAVANEGGVGVISSAGLGLLYRNLAADYLEASIEGLKEELRKAREKTVGVIGVNVMVAMSNFADMVRTSIAEKADIIFSGAGLPSTFQATLKVTVPPSWFPLFRRDELQKLFAKNGKRSTTTFPMPLWLKGQRQADTSALKPNKQTTRTTRLSNLFLKWFLRLRYLKSSTI